MVHLVSMFSPEASSGRMASTRGLAAGLFHLLMCVRFPSTLLCSQLPPPFLHPPLPSLEPFEPPSLSISQLGEFCSGTLSSSGNNARVTAVTQEESEVIVAAEGTQGHVGPRRAYLGHSDLWGISECQKTERALFPLTGLWGLQMNAAAK